MLNNALPNEAIFRNRISVSVADQIKFAFSHHRIACIDIIPNKVEANCAGIEDFSFLLRRSGTRSLVAI